MVGKVRQQRSGTTGSGLLGHGIYDVPEAARLVRVDPETAARWVSMWKEQPPLVRLVRPGQLTFLDLISLHVVAELRRRHVPRDQIAGGIQHLVDRLGTRHPLAHRDLATAGASFFARLDEWVDAGKGGQGAFEDVVLPLLRPIEYGTEGLAERWRPHRAVLIHPAVQAGTPCVEDSRTPTSLLRALFVQGETAEDLAEDYSLTVGHVEDALDYEEKLDRRAA